MLDVPYLILLHIPVNGYGYKTVHNFSQFRDAEKQEKIKITELTSRLKHQFQIDKGDHSLFQISTIDKKDIEVTTAHIFSDLTDETKRSGIIFGFYFRKQFLEFDMRNFANLDESASNVFLHISELHRSILSPVEISSNLIDEYVDKCKMEFNKLVSILGNNVMLPVESDTTQNLVTETTPHGIQEPIKPDPKCQAIIKDSVQSKNDQSILTRLLQRVLGWVPSFCNPKNNDIV